MPEPDLTDWERINLYMQRPVGPRQRAKLLGSASAKSFSLPATVISEMERQAARGGATISDFAFKALVREILARRTWEKHRDRAGRVAAEKIPDDAKAGGSTKRAKGA